MKNMNWSIVLIATVLCSSMLYVVVSTYNMQANHQIAQEKILNLLNKIDERLSTDQLQSVPSYSISDIDKLEGAELRITQAVAGLLKNELTEIIDDSVYSAIQSSEESKQAYSQAEQTIFDNPENIQQRFEQAESILSSAIQEGVWNQESADSFNTEIGQLPTEEAFELQKKLAIAINNGDIEINDDTIPF